MRMDHATTCGFELKLTGDLARFADSSNADTGAVFKLLKIINMQSNSKLLTLSGALLIAGLIGGCATGTTSQDSMGNMSGSQMDMQAMCEKHKGMMAGKSTAEQQAMMADHMKSMSSEMRTRMQAMHDKCKAS